MDRKEFFKKARGFAGEDGIKKIQWAYLLAKETHRRQKRDEGERYFEHCRRTALILMDCGRASEEEIIMALLHDVIEDGYLVKDMLKELFGKKVAEGIAMLSKCENIPDGCGFVRKNKKSDAAYHFGIGLADTGIRRVKAADRLDNLKTMSLRPKRWRRQYIKETKIFILPLICCRECGGELFCRLVSEIQNAERSI